MTGKVVVNRSMSLDGFIAGPGHRMDWVFEYVASDMVSDVMAATGAMLIGRRTYDVGQRDAGKPSGEAYSGLWSGPVFVLTHSEPVPANSGVSFLSGDVSDAVKTGLHAADGKDLEVLGSDVTRQCLELGLIDEIFVLVLPVLLGGGTPFFTPADGPARVNLEPVSAKPSGAVTALRYRVVRGCAS
jgi:dihydrofolate reductase